MACGLRRFFTGFISEFCSFALRAYQGSIRLPYFMVTNVVKGSYEGFCAVTASSYL